MLGREVSQDAIAALREEGLVAAGPRSPTPGSPYAYVRRRGFLRIGFSLATCRTSKSCQDAGLSARTGAAKSAGVVPRPEP